VKRAGATRTPVLLDFYAHEFEGKVRLIRVDVDSNSVMVDRHRVYSIPTVVFIRRGREIGRIIGAKSEDQYRAEIIRETDQPSHEVSA
jgi:thioredoxin-like negative regulator of GroEL